MESLVKNQFLFGFCLFLGTSLIIILAEIIGVYRVMPSYGTRFRIKDTLDKLLCLCYTKNMKNLKNNLITLGLVMGVVVASVAVAPANAEAYKTVASYQVCDGCVTSGSTSPTLNPEPVIDMISPEKVYVGSPTIDLAIYGSNFMPNSVARWDNANRPTAYVSSGKLFMQVPAEDLDEKGVFTVTVFNPGPGGGLSNAKLFTVMTKATPTTTTTKTTTVKKTTTPTVKTAAVKKTTVELTDEAMVCVPASQLAGLQLTGSDQNNDDTDATLTASAKNSNGRDFLPNTLVEWLLLVVLIYFAIKLFRKLYTTKAEQEAPLKQA